MDKLSIIDFFDKARWCKENDNKDILNYKYDEKELSNDEKILVHWLTYIMDRQMPFEQIWNVGAYVFTDIVRDFVKGKDVDDILNINKDSSYCKLIKINKEDKNNDILFITSKNLEKESDLLEKYYNSKEKIKIYNIDEDKIVFKSRFYTSDYFSIYHTLYTLEKLKSSKKIPSRSIIKYIEKIIKNNKENEMEVIIRKVAFGLHLLTYSNIGQPEKSDIISFCKNNKKELKKLDERYEIIEKFLNKETIPEEEKFYKSKMYESKRIWCCIRDYVRARYYSKYVADELEEDIRDILFKKKGKEYIVKDDVLKELILPGDVWNNNKIFRNCLFNKDEKGSLNKLLKKSDEKINTEKYDITFSFVPRMCSQNNCQLCPFDKFIKKKSENNEFDKLCTKSKNKYCQVAMYCAGYKYLCNPENCIFNIKGEK